MIEDLTRIRLMAVWKAWDQAPGSDVRARTMEDVCRKSAAEIGLTVNELRARLQAGRRAGLSRGASLDAAMKDPPAAP